MKMKYRKSGYKKAEIEGEFEGNKKITLGLADYSWQYIKSMTFDELETNRKLIRKDSAARLQYSILKWYAIVGVD
jgi:hypothetical protein